MQEMYIVRDLKIEFSQSLRLSVCKQHCRICIVKKLAECELWTLRKEGRTAILKTILAITWRGFINTHQLRCLIWPSAFCSVSCSNLLLFQLFSHSSFLQLQDVYFCLMIHSAVSRPHPPPERFWRKTCGTFLNHFYKCVVNFAFNSCLLVISIFHYLMWICGSVLSL